VVVRLSEPGFTVSLKGRGDPAFLPTKTGGEGVKDGKERLNIKQSSESRGSSPFNAMDQPIQIQYMKVPTPAQFNRRLYAMPCTAYKR